MTEVTFRVARGARDARAAYLRSYAPGGAPEAAQSIRLRWTPKESCWTVYVVWRPLQVPLRRSWLDECQHAAHERLLADVHARYSRTGAEAPASF